LDVLAFEIIKSGDDFIKSWFHQLFFRHFCNVPEGFRPIKNMNNRPFTKAEKLLIGIVMLAIFLLHFIVNMNGAYGFFRDELYYIACSEHLSWGYVDQPPLSVYLLKICRLLMGDSLAGIRVLPALCIATVIWITALIVKEMGGNFLAIMLASVAVFVSPIHIAMGSFYSMNPIDMVVWALVAFIILRIVHTEEKYLWIVLGIVLGLGLLNKISVLFIGAGLAAGLIFTQRKWLRTPWPYLAGAIAFVMFAPYMLWNVQHDMAHLEFIESASSGKYAGRNVMDFIKEIIGNHHPLSAPLWIIGLFALFFYGPLKKFSVVGWLFLIPLIILIVQQTSKGEYLTPGITMAFAGGAVFIEKKLAGSRKWVIYTYAVILIGTMIVLLPMVTPILPVEKYISYSQSLGIKPDSNEKKKLAELPQFYADMFGWKEKARDVARVFNTLSDEDKKRCAIFSDNYGRCAAIDFFGEQYGLPKSIGNHNSYWIWGPRDTTGDVVIILGGDMEDHVGDFESVVEAGISTCRYCMPYENNVKIFVGRGLKYPAAGPMWKEIKHYD
jgi:hypothetical protein